MDFKKQLIIYQGLVNAELERAMAEFTDKDVDVSDAMAYSLMAGGKRIRPVLALGVCDALGGDMQEALTFGCAVELVHTYSLIHDDLPCMDNDTMRRGKPTCHVKFGEATALLAGDALLTLAFEYVAQSAQSERKAFRFMKCLAECAGISGMVGGQADDIKAELGHADINTLRAIHKRKTGALINAAGAAGALAADKDMWAAKEYTTHLGIAFQIKDDILDVEGDKEKMGKTLGKDKEENKSTYVSLLGLEKAKEELKRESAEAERALDAFGEAGEFLRGLTDALLYRTK